MGLGVGLTLLAAAFAWNVGTLQAQNKAKVQNGIQFSPEEVSEQFITLLSTLSNRRYHTDIYFHFDKSGPVSQKSLKELNSSIGYLLLNMANQLEKPHFTSYLSQSDQKSARVKVERDEAAHPHEVVLLKEEGAWKVDLVATYAAWNKLSIADAKKRIHSTFDPRSNGRWAITG